MKIKKKSYSPFYKGLSLKKKIKYAYLRIKYGYCDLDLWNINYWFISVFPEMLKELSIKIHSHPSNLTLEEWSSTLKKMADYFIEADEDKCHLKDSLEEVEHKLDEYRFSYYKKYGNPISRLDKHLREGSGYQSIMTDGKYLELLEEYKKVSKEISDYCKTNLDLGLNLLSLYFYDLWD